MKELALMLRDLLPMMAVSVVIYVFNVPWLGYLRIDAVALTVILFCLYRPKAISLLLVFLLGLLQDVVSLAPLGQHALGLCIVAYFMQYFRDRVRIHSVAKQLPSIALALLFLKLVYSWVTALGFGQLPSLNAVLSVLLTTMLWPLMVAFGDLLAGRRKLPGISY